MDVERRNEAPADVPNPGPVRLVVLAYITACAMPPVGFVLGIVVWLRLTRPISKHGPWIIVLSIVAAGIWWLIISGGALNTTNTGY